MAYAVVTRDQAAAAPYAVALAPLGLEVIAMPLTHTAEPLDRDALARALERGGYAAIVCTSARAASALIDARGGATLPEIWALGFATARPLERAKLAAFVPPEAHNGASLARAVLSSRQLAGQRVLVPRAEDGREDAIEILRAGGVTVDSVIAYRTVAVTADDPAIARGRELFATKEVAVCAVFAPSQVTALDALARIRQLTAQFAAIGETTAAALRDAGARDITVAESPTPEGIAKAVAAVYPPRR